MDIPDGPRPTTHDEYIIEIYNIVRGINNTVGSLCEVQADHETRLRDVEEWKQRAVGGVGLLGVGAKFLGIGGILAVIKLIWDGFKPTGG